MKTIYLLLLTILVATSPVLAQDTQLYNENFSSSNKGITASPANSWYRSLGAWRTQNSTATTTRTFNLDYNISTMGYTNVTVGWSGYRSSSPIFFGFFWVKNDYELELFYSVNGGTFKKVTGWSEDRANYNNWETVNGGKGIVLPKETENVKSLRLSWKIKVTGDEYVAIDNITMEGTEAIMSPTQPGLALPGFVWGSRAANENPFTVSGPAAAAPYRLDGVAMRFSRTIDTGVMLTEARVSDTRFQSPKSSLSLVQTGATATRGTNVRIDFEELISDLTFTLFDVDQEVGQFQDKLIVTGVAADGKTIKPNQENVRSTSSLTKYNATTGTIISESGRDISSDSEQGNARVVFTEPVNQVNITYLNNDRARGQQGIGIYNIYGRSNPLPLPVELISFKGKAQDKAAVLNWATAMEKNNEVFVVERSQNGEVFTAQGHVKGNGNSATTLHYTYTDANVTPGTHYYRLQQVDLDGTVTYSKVIAVEVTGNLAEDKEQLATLFPTIASHEINVKLHVAQAQILILDASGKTITTIANQTEENLVLPVSHLQRGAYFMLVNNGQRRETLRFFKQ